MTVGAGTVVVGAVEPGAVVVVAGAVVGVVVSTVSPPPQAARRASTTLVKSSREGMGVSCSWSCWANPGFVATYTSERTQGSGGYLVVRMKVDAPDVVAE
jgi:hypothetical protein